MANSFINRRSEAEGKGEMAFVDHLEELRWHIIRSLLVIIVLAVVIFINIEWVFEKIIAGPINPDFISYKLFCDFSHFLHIGDTLCMPPLQISMQTTTFGGQFVSAISISFITGIIVAFPYIFWEIWRFIKPALKPNEVKNTRFVIFWVSFFFFLGAMFGYFMLGPFTFNFLANFKVGFFIDTKPTINDYIDNLTNIILGCGIAFELPVVAFALTKIGIITPKFLVKYRRYAIVVILVVAAVITPSPDWISQMIVFTPLFLLYQFSILVSKRAYKSFQEKEKEEWS